MKFRKLVDIAEIVGTLAVIISLVLVVRSIDENTKVIQSSEYNNIWNAWREVAVLPIITGGDLAAVSAKVKMSEALSPAEQIQWDAYLSAQLDIWAQLFESHNNRLISSDYWQYWDNGFWRLWKQNGYARIYEFNRDFLDPKFQDYVDAQIIERDL